MDLLPIKPTSTNKVDPSINLANDGGSKSNTGYFSSRGADPEGQNSESVDEVKFSKSSARNDVEDGGKEFIEIIKEYLNKIKQFILKIFRFKKKEIYNIYEKNTH